MKKTTVIALILTLSLVTGCSTTQAGNNAGSGAGLGALIGATVGALTFKNKISGAAIGAGVGTVVGYMVGNEMDKSDRAYVSEVLETRPSGRAVGWTNPHNKRHYRATPHRARRHGRRIVRDVTLECTTPEGNTETVYARAYRQPDGSWQLDQ